MTSPSASLKKISLESIFFRHVIEEDRLVGIMSHVLKNKGWDLPPPLLVQQAASGLKYYWVLDGHHRVTAAKLFEASLKKVAKIWAFVVTEGDYERLIQEKFSGLEPLAIRQVREHIALPFGDANMIDEAWGTIGNSLSKKISASFPTFVLEKNRNSVSNIGFFTTGFTLDGSIWIKDGESQRTVIKMRNPPSRKNIREDHSIRLRGDDGEDIEIDISAKWDFSKKCAEIEVISKGIRLSEEPPPNTSNGSKSRVVTKEQIYNQSKLIIAAIRKVNRDFDGIAVDGINDDQREAPWFLLDEFDFSQPDVDAAPDPKEFKRAKRKDKWSRRHT